VPVVLSAGLAGPDLQDVFELLSLMWSSPDLADLKAICSNGIPKSVTCLGHE
jgi:hypothetical protein